jgi:hypothetical protein
MFAHPWSTAEDPTRVRMAGLFLVGAETALGLGISVLEGRDGVSIDEKSLGPLLPRRSQLLMLRAGLRVREPALPSRA